MSLFEPQKCFQCGWCAVVVYDMNVKKWPRPDQLWHDELAMMIMSLHFSINAEKPLEDFKQS